MKFEEVLPALRAGEKITCNTIKDTCYKYIYYKEGVLFTKNGGYWHLTDSEIFKEDSWEIVKKKKKVKWRDLIKEQFNSCCSKYSDEFLDQEIEVEEDD